MVDNNLNNYINEQRANGFSDEVIKNALIQYGYDPNTIHEILNQKNTQKSSFLKWFIIISVCIIFLFLIIFLIYSISIDSPSKEKLLQNNEKNIPSNKSVNNPVNKLVDKPSSKLADIPVNNPINNQANNSVNYLVNKVANKSFNKLADIPVNNSVNKPVINSVNDNPFISNISNNSQIKENIDSDIIYDNISLEQIDNNLSWFDDYLLSAIQLNEEYKDIHASGISPIKMFGNFTIKKGEMGVFLIMFFNQKNQIIGNVTPSIIDCMHQSGELFNNISYYSNINFVNALSESRHNLFLDTHEMPFGAYLCFLNIYIFNQNISVSNEQIVFSII